MAIKTADRIAAYYEATQLAGFTQTEANRYFGVPRGVPAALRERLRRSMPQPVAVAQAAVPGALQRACRRSDEPSSFRHAS